jgi:hypothetical protein
MYPVTPMLSVAVYVDTGTVNEVDVTGIVKAETTGAVTSLGAVLPLSNAPMSGNPTIGFPLKSVVNPTFTPALIAFEIDCKDKSVDDFTFGSTNFECVSQPYTDLIVVLSLLAYLA